MTFNAWYERQGVGLDRAAAFAAWNAAIDAAFEAEMVWSIPLAFTGAPP